MSTSKREMEECIIRITHRQFFFIIVISILILQQYHLQCLSQYVCLIDSNGLKGNISFSPSKVSERTNDKQHRNNALKIEAYFELADGKLTGSHNNPTATDPLLAFREESIRMDWSIHSNSFDYNTLVASSCSDEIQGSQISKSVSEGRILIIGQHHVWTHQDDTGSIIDPSQLIWGRSVRLKYHPATIVSKRPTDDNSTASNNRKKPLAPMIKPNEASSSQSQYSNLVVCCNVFDTRDVKTAQSVFTSEIGGRVIFRGNQEGITTINTDLYHIKSKLTTKHEWKILASDILDDRRHESECRYLQVLFDPDNVDERNCKRDDHQRCRMGDLAKKHGLVSIAGLGKSAKTTMIDTNLPISALEGARSLFLAIFEQSASGSIANKTRNIASCAQIVPLKQRNVRAKFSTEGVSGWFRFRQRHFNEPTYISYDLHNLEGNVKSFKIHQLPVLARISHNDTEACSKLGSVFNPFRVATPIMGSDLSVNFTSQPIVKVTLDQFEVGNLDGKHGPLKVVDSEYDDHYAGEFVDLNLPLFGRNSIVGRALLIKKNNGEVWICSTIDYHEDPVKTAVATFHYPVVGHITFRQLADEAESETSVLVEVHNTVSITETQDHNWQIHLKPALADFYNWSSRCESVAEVYDPFQASTSLTGDQYIKQCRAGPELRCRAGDLAIKSGQKLTLTSDLHNRSLVYYHDLFIPLSKQYSIIGRSVVIYDEKSPTQRGIRLACATIKTSHPLRASVKSWNSGPSIPSSVQGSIVFRQESPTRETLVDLDLNGLGANVEQYSIHDSWTMGDKEFPCSNDSTYGIYDPYDKEGRLPPSAHFSPLQTADQFKVGDLSRKHGFIEATSSASRHYFDSNLPLFAPGSIIGRSVVLRARNNDFRWVCGNIELDYDRSQTREVVGVASFDDTRSNIAGYVRFRQLEHKDGSMSDTWIQMDLRTRNNGAGEFQISHGHNWVVFVNQVGEDAFNNVDSVRCIAAGFKWNPYLAQDKLDIYKQSCTIKEPLTCAMGDLGFRQGFLTLGPNNRQVFSDTNLPLVGNHSIMGRSIIIFDNKSPNIKLACANILPDIHLLSNVVVRRNPSFTVTKFVEQMRSLLDATDWLVVPELRATKVVADGECVQMTIHFYGQRAHQLQIEMNNLITFGSVRKATRHGTEKISTHYKLCRAVYETSGARTNHSNYRHNLIVILLVQLLVYVCINVQFLFSS